MFFVATDAMILVATATAPTHAVGLDLSEHLVLGAP